MLFNSWIGMLFCNSNTRFLLISSQFSFFIHYHSFFLVAHRVMAIQKHLVMFTTLHHSCLFAFPVRSQSFLAISRSHLFWTNPLISIAFFTNFVVFWSNSCSETVRAPGASIDFFSRRLVSLHLSCAIISGLPHVPTAFCSSSGASFANLMLIFQYHD